MLFTKQNINKCNRSKNTRECSGLVRSGKHLMEEVELEIEGFMQQGGVGDPDTGYKKRKATLVLKKLVV